MSPKPDEYLGCGCSGCEIEPPKGVRPAGGCDCLRGMDPPKRVKLRRAIARDRRKIAELESRLETLAQVARDTPWAGSGS